MLFLENIVTWLLLTKSCYPTLSVSNAGNTTGYLFLGNCIRDKYFCSHQNLKKKKSEAPMWALSQILTLNFVAIWAHYDLQSLILINSHSNMLWQCNWISQTASKFKVRIRAIAHIGA